MFFPLFLFGFIRTPTKKRNKAVLFKREKQKAPTYNRRATTEKAAPGGRTESVPEWMFQLRNGCVNVVQTSEETEDMCKVTHRGATGRERIGEHSGNTSEQASLRQLFEGCEIAWKTLKTERPDFAPLRKRSGNAQALPMRFLSVSEEFPQRFRSDP